MLNLTGYNDVKAADSDAQKLPNLPCGEYICKIVGAKAETIKGKDGNSYDMLNVAVDIDEGKFKGYFAQRFKADKDYYDEPKWKAVIRFFVINKFSGKVDKRFKKFLEDVAFSNKDYKFDTDKFDEKTLKGKIVGVIFDENKFEKDGRQFSFVQPTRTKPAENIIIAEDFDGEEINDDDSMPF